MDNPELSNWVDGHPLKYREILEADNCLVVSLAKAAELLGVSYGTAREYTRRGWLFAPNTFGGRVLVTKASIQQFLTEGPAMPTPAPVFPVGVSKLPPARHSGTFNLDALRRKR